MQVFIKCLVVAMCVSLHCSAKGRILARSADCTTICGYVVQREGSLHVALIVQLYVAMCVSLHCSAKGRILARSANCTTI